jgi:hypothetical protein
MISLSIENDDLVRAALRRYGAKAADLIDRAINASGLDVDREVKKSIQRGPKAGIVYQKINPKRTHRASAENEPPATDTGRLVSSIYFTREYLSATVGSPLAYAYHLEFGTFRIKPRPAWVPAVQKVRPKFNERIISALRRAAE